MDSKFQFTIGNPYCFNLGIVSLLPIHYWAKSSLYANAKAISLLFRIDKAASNLRRPNETIVCVEINLDYDLSEKIWIEWEKLNGCWQAVLYDKKSKLCYRCRHIGHTDDHCTLGIRHVPSLMSLLFLMLTLLLNQLSRLRIRVRKMWLRLNPFRGKPLFVRIERDNTLPALQVPMFLRQFQLQSVLPSSFYVLYITRDIQLHRRYLLQLAPLHQLLAQLLLKQDYSNYCSKLYGYTLEYSLSSVGCNISCSSSDSISRSYSGSVSCLDRNQSFNLHYTNSDSIIDCHSCPSYLPRSLSS